MISPDIFTQEDEVKKERQQGLMGAMASMFVRNLKSAINEIAGKSVFKVKVEGSEQEAILRKILGLLHSISAYSKMSQGVSSPPQKISIKTADLTLSKSIEDILKRIEAKQLIVKIPEISKVQGEVKMTNFPEVSKVSGAVKIVNFPEQYDFDKLEDMLFEIKQALSNIRLEIPPQREIKFPEIKFPDFPKTVGLAETKAILNALNDVKETLENLPKKIPQMEFPQTINVGNFPPQKYPMPVTHVSINSLAGEVKTRAVTVTTALTPLPGEVLSNRRSLTIYNNSSVTVEVGGSTFTFGEGMPVPAGTFSPALDAGSKMIIYGRVASGTADVRVMEVSDLSTGR